MHYGKKASRQRQCDALGNVLLRNLDVLHSCGRYFDTYPNSVANIVQECFEEHDKEFQSG